MAIASNRRPQQALSAVSADDGRLLDLGSFRATGGFLADVLNLRTGTEQYDYLSFQLASGSRDAQTLPLSTA